MRILNNIKGDYEPDWMFCVNYFFINKIKYNRRFDSYLVILNIKIIWIVTDI